MSAATGRPERNEDPLPRLTIQEIGVDASVVAELGSSVLSVRDQPLGVSESLEVDDIKVLPGKGTGL